jgi:methylmalonyl-CoA mutase N-terminal domain/subunit
VADPLAGSYYVESLTEQIEHEIRRILDEIDGLGGLAGAIKRGWMDQQIEKAWLARQQELENKERIVVGVNEFTVPEEEDVPVPVYHHEVDQEVVELYLRDFRELKKSRSQQKVQNTLDEYRKAVEKEDQALVPYAVECCRAYATTAELNGVHRMARGLSYDPYDMVEYPFR